MTTFENLTPLRNFASGPDRGHVTQASFGGFSKPGFGAVVDWREERERVREEKGKARATATPARDSGVRDSTARDPVARDSVARDSRDSAPANHRQSLSTIFGNFRPSRDSFAASESFSESREHDASVNLSRDLSQVNTTAKGVVKTSFKELFQRAMSKSRESGARDSLLLGVARDRNSILGHAATHNTLVEEDETGEVEMELTDVALRDRSGLREMAGLSRDEGSVSRDDSNSRSRDSPRVFTVTSADTSLASPVKTEEEDGMDFTNVPHKGGSRESGSRDSGSSRDSDLRDSGSHNSSSRDSGEMDFTNVTLARDIAEARAAIVSDESMDFTNVGSRDDTHTTRARGLSRISERDDSDSMDYTSASIPSVARIVSEEVLVRSGLSPGGSPRVRELSENESMEFTNVPRSSKLRQSESNVGDTSGMDFTNVPRSNTAQFAVPAVPQNDNGNMSFTNVPTRASVEGTAEGTRDMSFTNVPRRASISHDDTPRGIKRRRVDDAGEMEFTEVVGVADLADTSAMDFTRPVESVTAAAVPSTTADTSAMDFTVPISRADTSAMDFTGPVGVPSTASVGVPSTSGTSAMDASMDFTKPVATEGEVEMSFTRPVDVPETEDMSFTRPVDVSEHSDMSFTRPVEVPDEDMSFTNTNTNTNYTNYTRSTGTGMDFTRPVPGGIEVGEIGAASGVPRLSRKSLPSRDPRPARDDHSDYEFTAFGQQLDSSTRLLPREDVDMERSLEEPLEEPPSEEDDHVIRERSSHVDGHVIRERTSHVTIPLADDISTPPQERPLSTIAETTEREDSAGNTRSTYRYPGNNPSNNQGITVATNSGTFGTQFSTPFSTPAASAQREQQSTPGKRPFSELSRDETTTPEQSRDDDDDDDMDLTAPMSLKHRFELLSTPRKVKVKRRGGEFGSARIGNSVSRDAKALARPLARVGSRVGDFGSPAIIPSDSLTMTKFLQMIDMQFMDDFLLPGKRKPSADEHPKCSLTQYLIDSYLHPHVQLYSWAVEHLRKDIEVRSANFAQLDQETLNDVPPIFIDYTSADSGVKLLLNKQFALDKQYYRVEARKSWYEWRKSISIDLYKRLATNRDLLRSDLTTVDRESETLSKEVADLKQSLEGSNSQLTQLRNLSTDVELKRQVCSQLQQVQQELAPLVDKLEQVNQTVVELESEVSKEVQKQDELKTQLMEQQKRLLDNRHIDFREIELLQEQLKKAEQKKGLKLVRFESPSGDAVFESRDLRMTVSRETNHVIAIEPKTKLDDDSLKHFAVKLLPLGTETVAGVTQRWGHVTRFFAALAEITLAFNSRYHVTESSDGGQFELFIKLLTHKGQSRTDVHVRFPFSEIVAYPNMTGCHVTSKCVYGVNSGVSFTTFDACLEVLLSVR